jgi:hypothetical protein
MIKMIIFFGDVSAKNPVKNSLHSSVAYVIPYFWPIQISVFIDFIDFGLEKIKKIFGSSKIIN